MLPPAIAAQLQVDALQRQMTSGLSKVLISQRTARLAQAQAAASAASAAALQALNAAKGAKDKASAADAAAKKADEGARAQEQAACRPLVTTPNLFSLRPLRPSRHHP